VKMMVEKNKEDDCPAELVELFDSSKSDWRKGVIKQFMESHEWRQETNRRLKRMERYEKIAVALLSVIGSTLVIQAIPLIMQFLQGIL